jgi:geranylgeranyl diphosphate synthase type I
MTAQTARAGSDPVLTSLARARRLVDPALRAAVDRLDSDTRVVASYHLGWCEPDGTPATGNPGKAVRPGLVLLAAEAVGGDPADAVAPAVAVELVHNFSLVHDDLMDRDAERRHRATVWAVWDDATAVLVGDALLSLAHEVLLDGSPGHRADHGRHADRAVAASRVLARATRELIHGQVLDMAFETRDEVSLEECLGMAARKTGALLSASAELGALAGGADPGTAAALRTYGTEVGLAFQLVDDLLGIWGWPERTGKPVYSDLRTRKKTLPVVRAVTGSGPGAAELADWLATPPPPGGDTEEALRHAADLVERAGGREWAVAEARARVAAGLAALDGAARLDAPGHEALAALADFIGERDL